MPALVRIVPVERVRVAVMVRDGLGWRVGLASATLGPLAASEAHMTERAAVEAVAALADAHDVMAVRHG